MNKKEAESIVLPHVYEKDNLKMIKFQGTRGDYTSELVFVGVTPTGNIRAKEIVGHAQGGIPDRFRNRIAKLRTRDSKYYWWIEDGTGSLIFKP